MEWPPQQTCTVVIIIIIFYFLYIDEENITYMYLLTRTVCVQPRQWFFISLANLSTYLSFTHSLSFHKLDIFYTFLLVLGFTISYRIWTCLSLSICWNLNIIEMYYVNNKIETFMYVQCLKLKATKSLVVQL